MLRMPNKYAILHHDNLKRREVKHTEVLRRRKNEVGKNKTERLHLGVYQWNYVIHFVQKYQ